MGDQIMGKHTPRPWIVNVESKSLGCIPITLQTGATLARVSVFDSKTARRSESEANAVLIAAAPELLESLKLAYDIIKNGGNNWACEKKIIEAISKAEGRS